MRHEIKQGGCFEDSRGAVAAKIAKQRHADLTKEIRKTKRSIEKMKEDLGYLSKGSGSFTHLTDKIEMKMISLGNLEAEAKKVQSEAIKTAFE